MVFEQLFDHEVLDGIYPEYMRLYKKVLEREQSMKGTCEYHAKRRGLACPPQSTSSHAHRAIQLFHVHNLSC